MFSKWKQALYEVKDGIERQRKLVCAYFIWIVICTYWMADNNTDIHEFYRIHICMADFLILFQGAMETGIMVFPFAAFLVMKCKQNSLNIQYILRYGTRKQTLQKQIMESVWYSFAVSVSLVAVQLGIGWIKNGILMNWDDIDSLYYYKLGEFCEIGFGWVVFGVTLMYLIKFLIIFVCMDILLWYPKGLFLVWILLVLFAGIEGYAHKEIFYGFFGIWHELWKKPIRLVGKLGIGAVCIGLEYLCGVTLIKKKDILR